jgi:hypothetical protein
MFVLDFPASILLVRLDLGLNHPALIFGIGGTIWWLLVSVALSEAFRLVSLPFRKAALKNRASAR